MKNIENTDSKINAINETYHFLQASSLNEKYTI